MILTPDDHEELAIPGARYGFATLTMAEALGDLSTLRSAHRRVLWLSVPAPAADAIERLAPAIASKLTGGKAISS